MRIHLIIFITHSELAVVTVTDILNLYKRKINKESSLVYNEEDFNDKNDIKIDKILRKRITRDKSKYLLY